MAAIDVGATCENKGGQASFNYTFITNANTADGTGTIDDICVWMAAGGTVQFATFTLESGTSYSTNGTATGVTVSSGQNNLSAPGDFTAFDVDTGDKAGMCCPTDVRVDNQTWGTPTGDGIKRDYGDSIPCTNTDFGSDYKLKSDVQKEYADKHSDVDYLPDNMDDDDDIADDDD